MKKITVLALMLLGFSTLSFAQRSERERMDPMEVAQKRADKMKQDLKLNEMQYQKILELNQKVAEKRVDTRSAERAHLEAKREVIKKDRVAYSSSLQTILSPEQFEMHKANLEKRKDDRKGPHRRGRN